MYAEVQRQLRLDLHDAAERSRSSEIQAKGRQLAEFRQVWSGGHNQFGDQFAQKLADDGAAVRLCGPQPLHRSCAAPITHVPPTVNHCVKHKSVLSALAQLYLEVLSTALKISALSVGCTYPLCRIRGRPESPGSAAARRSAHASGSPPLRTPAVHTCKDLSIVAETNRGLSVN